MNGFTDASNGPTLPLVSVVTPVLDGRRFIARAVESILTQTYPNVEYIVVDGDSRDGTLDVLQPYKDRLSLHVLSGSNQAQALNAGFSRARGQIFGVLNADDEYLPGAIAAAVEALACNPSAVVAYGEADHIDENGGTIAPYPVESYDAEALARRCIVCQPAAFFRSSAFAQAGGFDETLNYALDYDLWIRMSRLGPFVKVDAKIAQSRMHPGNKTLGRRRAAYAESMRVLSRQYRYVPYEWVYAYASHLIDRRDHFFERARPTRLGVLCSLPLGLVINRASAIRYFRDWMTHRGVGNGSR